MYATLPTCQGKPGAKDGKKAKAEYGLVAQSYRRLMKNYEAAREYNIAGDFYVGAMEMERKILRQGAWKGFFSFRLAAHELYRRISNYGESYKRAFLWLFALSVFWWGVYWFQGFSPGRAAGAVLRVLTFQRAGDMEASLWTGLQALTTFPVLALFLLALKRRFRR